MMLTVLRDIHELDGNLLPIFLVLSKHYLSESALPELLDDLVVIEYRTEVEVFPYLATGYKNNKSTYPSIRGRGCLRLLAE